MAMATLYIYWILYRFMLFTRLFMMTGTIWVVRVIILVLQIQGMYFTWYGVCLEAIFSLPEAIFPLMLFMRREVISWTWNEYPTVAGTTQFCIAWFFSVMKRWGLRAWTILQVASKHWFLGLIRLLVNYVLFCIEPIGGGLWLHCRHLSLHLHVMCEYF